MKSNKAKIDKWFKDNQFTVNRVRKRLGITPAQAERIVNGDYEGFEQLIMWWMSLEARDVSEALTAIREHTGLSVARCALLLGLDERNFSAALDGQPVKGHTAMFIEMLAKHLYLVEELKDKGI